MKHIPALVPGYRLLDRYCVERFRPSLQKCGHPVIKSREGPPKPGSIGSAGESLARAFRGAMARGRVR